MSHLRFFVDHCVPTSVAETLQSDGHEILLLRDCLPVNSDDDLVISKAQELDALLLSMNGDFSNLVTYPPADYKGIFALQVKNTPKVLPHIVQRLINYLSNHPEMSHYRGKLFLVEPHRIRIRQ